jgi:Adenylate and Guanylate cyclase catalytic domain
VEPERRQVTVLFTDMVGFTTFSERSGEEAAYTLMRSLSKLMEDAVYEQGGVVQSFTGDGIMAVFGAPVTFEDAPLHACRAALDILDRLKAAAPSLEAKHGVRPQLRIGLNAGVAVVGRVQQPLIRLDFFAKPGTLRGARSIHRADSRGDVIRQTHDRRKKSLHRPRVQRSSASKSACQHCSFTRPR